MDTPRFSQYSLPLPNPHYKQFLKNPAAPVGSVPELQSLVTLKLELEGFTTKREHRVKQLERDLAHIEKTATSKHSRENGLRRERGDHDRDRAERDRDREKDGKGVRANAKVSGSSGTTKDKDGSGGAERVRVKQETSDGPLDEDLLHTNTSSSSKNRSIVVAKSVTPEPSSHPKQKRKREPEDDSDVSEPEKEKRPPVTPSKKNPKPQSRRSASPINKPGTPVRHSTPKAPPSIQKVGKKQGTIQKKRSDLAAISDDIPHTPSPFKPLSGASSSTTPVQRSTSIPVEKKQQKEQSKDQEEEIMRVKPKDQTPIQTFWQSVEPWFRPLTEEDMTFLEEKSDDPNPYVIPRLGKYYWDVWADEERNLIPQLDTLNSPTSSSAGDGSRRNSVDAYGANSKKSVYLGPGEWITEDHLNNEELSCGPLTERILASLVKEDVINIKDIKKDGNVEEDGANDPEVDVPSSKTVADTEIPPARRMEVVEFEERLKRELRFIGLLGDEDIDWSAREDDEVCAELRKLQTRLKEQVRINELRKKRTLELVQMHMAYQEYNQILDNLDSQVEQAYIKRFRVQKSKKRKTIAPAKQLSDNAVHAMDKRKKWLNSVGQIFGDKSRFSMPTKSVYEGIEDEIKIGSSSKVLNGISHT